MSKSYMRTNAAMARARAGSEWNRVVAGAAKAAEAIRSRLLATGGDEMHRWLGSKECAREFALMIVRAHYDEPL